MKIPLLILGFILILVSCENPTTSTSSNQDGNVKFITKQSSSALSPQYRENDSKITPSSYKLAIVSFNLLKEDGSEVALIEASDDNPVIISFSEGSESSQTLLEDKVLEGGKYTGYNVRFLYMEMTLPVYFNIPSDAYETDYTQASDITCLSETSEYEFRVYFNAVGKYWKRDFAVKLPDDNYYWMRRSIEDKINDSGIEASGGRNFFISVADNDHPGNEAHPQESPGTESILDLFDMPEFWGEDETWPDSNYPITIETGNEFGINTYMSEFTINGGNDVLLLEVDISDTMWFGDSAQSDAPETTDGTAYGNTSPVVNTITMHDNVFDVGPSYSVRYTDPNNSQPMEEYLCGDGGLRPMLPNFLIKLIPPEDEPVPEEETQDS